MYGLKTLGKGNKGMNKAKNIPVFIVAKFGKM